MSLTLRPYFGPRAGRLGRSRNAMRLSDSDVSRTSRTLSSSLSWFATISSAVRSFGEFNSTIKAFNGCRTFIAAAERADLPSDASRIAKLVRTPKSLSITSSSATGQSARCTEVRRVVYSSADQVCVHLLGHEWHDGR